MKNQKIEKIKPNPIIFKNSKLGRIGFKPLFHKNGQPFDDVDYFEILGRKAIELDLKNDSKFLQTDYGEYDRDVVLVAKEVVKGLDNNCSRPELKKYITNCITI